MNKTAHTSDDLDEKLSLLCQTTPDGTVMSQSAIAKFCGCPQQLISSIERRALRKLRARALHFHLNDYLSSQEAA